MATMMCRAHGPVHGETCSIAGCFEPLQPYAATPGPPAASCPAAGCGMALPCPLHPTGAGDHATATGRGLRFPWGTVTVTDGGITVGRDCTGHCGTEIAGYDNVSRTHARIRTDGDRLTVVDLDSTNGTTVNGVRAQPDQPVSVKPGDVLGFGNRLRCTVVTGEDPT